MTAAPYPAVRARLRRTRSAPGTEAVRSTLVIALRGSRFRVVDETGRDFSDIVADVGAARGFGATPRTMEDFMDAFAAGQRGDRPPTELRADVATGEATVREAGGDPWPVDPDRIVPVAEQLLFHAEPWLRAAGEATALGRRCTEYRGVLEGEEDGHPWRSDVRLLVSGPYVLRRDVVDAAHPDLSARTEVVELDEGPVADDDL